VSGVEGSEATRDTRHPTLSERKAARGTETAYVITVVVTDGIDNYSYQMIEILRSNIFDRWLSGLRDRRAVVRIAARLDRLAAGNPGDAQPVGDGISELRVNYGPGYRVYFIQKGRVLIVLLCGGDKSTQDRDIRQAKVLASEWKD
jgi:putative addiction module killer protein